MSQYVPPDKARKQVALYKAKHLASVRVNPFRRIRTREPSTYQQELIDRRKLLKHRRVPHRRVLIAKHLYSDPARDIQPPTRYTVTVTCSTGLTLSVTVLARDTHEAGRMGAEIVARSRPVFVRKATATMERS